MRSLLGEIRFGRSLWSIVIVPKVGEDGGGGKFSILCSCTVYGTESSPDAHPP
jgi:hypothetical protein